MHPYIPVRVNRQRHDDDAIITAFPTVSPLISSHVVGVTA
jgi:hypothetical protein